MAATGPFQVPAVPRPGTDLAPRVVQLHSNGYRNPAQLPAGRVLVVGAGNSGAPIATELAATHEVTLAVGARQPSLPQHLAGRDLFFWLTRTHIMDITVGSRLGRRLATTEALIGTRLAEVARRGVRLSGRLTAVDGDIGSSPAATGSRWTRWCGPPGTDPTTPGCPPRRSARTAGHRIVAVPSPTTSGSCSTACTCTTPRRTT